MQLKTRKIYKHGNSHYHLIDRNIVKEYDLRKGQKLERTIELHENGFSINYQILQTTILERDEVWVKEMLGLNKNMPLPTLYKLFNPSGRNKDLMQGRLDMAYKNIVRRDSE